LAQSNLPVYRIFIESDFKTDFTAIKTTLFILELGKTVQFEPIQDPLFINIFDFVPSSPKA
jgi:hypothetical protein